MTPFLPSPAPAALAGGVIQLGGFTGYLPEEWQTHLQAEITLRLRAGSPAPAAGRAEPIGSTAPLAAPDSPPSSLTPAVDWHTNDCIFTSLQKILFHQFGILLPDDSIFKLYNPAGEGLSPETIVEAITAVISPVGVSIERIVVADPVLRAAVGSAPLVAGPERASNLDTHPGVCMINVGPGYSHAFFWEHMDARAVASPQFRMAVLLRRDPAGGEQPSIPRALSDYRDLAARALADTFSVAPAADLSGALPPAARAALTRLDDLIACAIHSTALQGAALRQDILRRLEAIAGGMDELLCGQTGYPARAARHAPVLLRRILLEAPLVN